MTEKNRKTPEEWKNELTPDQYEICINHGTEPPFSGKYNQSKLEGNYKCTCCGEELFSSDAKFDSMSGWPSFYDAVKGKVKLKKEKSIFGGFDEVICRKCGSHLGHVFSDAPQTPTGKRYCINSLALDFDSG